MSELAPISAKLSQGKLAEALRDLQTILEDTPDHLEALYLQAVASRYSGLQAQALASLERLTTLCPAHSRAHQETGHNYRDLGAQIPALQAYARALALNPALEASLRESAKLFRQAQQHQLAAQMEAQLSALTALPQPLRAAMDLIAQNKLLKAEALCRRYLQQHPKDVEGMRLLAQIGTQLGALEEAEFLLESAAQFEPQHLGVRMDHVQVLRKRQKFQAAVEAARQLMQSFPKQLQVKSLCAIEHMQIGDYETAMRLLDQVLIGAPNDPQTLVTYGHALKTCGELEQAVARYRRAIEQHPTHGEAYYSLANLKTYRFREDEVAQMAQLADSAHLGLTDRVYLNFALAKAFEDQGQYELAFQHYAQGNHCKRAQSNYDADRMRAEMEATQTTCDANFFAARQGFGTQAPDPIFVVGLPRAGSTLLEQILASHSQVDGTLELPDILSLAQRLRRRGRSKGYPENLADLTAQECRTFGEQYLADTQIHRADAPFFIDKMPNNFRYIGLIKLILPNAKIIDARREPMACCFSGFKQLFAEGQEFTYDLKDIARYYSDYVDLMAHWDRVLPGHVLRVQHEEVIDNLEGQVRRMLEFCGLPFESTCLKYYETERHVRTPSSEQVRQPIFKDSVQQWQNFKTWLDPLKDNLSPLALR